MSTRLDQLLKFHAADPKDPFCTYGIALEYAKLGDTAAAMQWLEKTLGLDPGYAYAHYQKAKLRIDAGDLAAARDAIDRGLAAAEQSGDAHAASELAALRETI